MTRPGQQRDPSKKDRLETSGRSMHFNNKKNQLRRKLRCLCPERSKLR